MGSAASLEMSSLNTEARLQQMLSDPKCDKECLGLCLSYFPSEAGVQKCGCQLAFLNNQFEHLQSMADGGEKFFQNSIDLSMVSPIVQEYKNQLRAIDFDILNRGMSHATVLAANETSSDTKVVKGSTVAGGKNESESNHTKPVHQFCKPDDEKCLEMLSQCVATCTQKCKSEPQDKRSSCIKLCKNQCMASYKVKSDQTENSYDYSYYDRYNSENGAIGENGIQALAAKGGAESSMAFDRIRAHASYLHEQGDLCQPNCIAKCGQLILATTSDTQGQGESAAIVQCFKQDCGCKSRFASGLHSHALVDQQLYQKYESDLQIEHLLLEKEVQDAIYYHTNAGLEQDSAKPADQEADDGHLAFISEARQDIELDQAPPLAQESLHNAVLDNIVKANLRRQRDQTLKQQSFWLTMTIISLVVVAFTATVLKYTAASSSGSNDYKNSFVHWDR